MVLAKRCNVLTALCVLLFTPAGYGWINSYDGHFAFKCDTRKFISHISGRHHNHYEDRVFQMSCRELPLAGQTTGCYWGSYVNTFDQPVVFQCYNNGHIVGIDSYHHNHYEDRRFKFHCCRIPNTVMHSCYYTHWVNNLDAVFSYTVPYGWVLAGMVSFHSNHHEDRRFRFQICRLRRL